LLVAEGPEAQGFLFRCNKLFYEIIPATILTFHTMVVALKCKFIGTCLERLRPISTPTEELFLRTFQKAVKVRLCEGTMSFGTGHIFSKGAIEVVEGFLPTTATIAEQLFGFHRNVLTLA
jgi:hypothetical protein